MNNTLRSFIVTLLLQQLLLLNVLPLPSIRDHPFPDTCLLTPKSSPVQLLDSRSGAVTSLPRWRHQPGSTRWRMSAKNKLLRTQRHISAVADKKASRYYFESISAVSFMWLNDEKNNPIWVSDRLLVELLFSDGYDFGHILLLPWLNSFDLCTHRLPCVLASVLC